MNKEKIRSKWASSGSSSEDGGEITHIRSKRRTKKHKAVVDAADTKQPINTAQVLVGPARPTIQDYEDISYYYADEVGGGVGEVDSQPVATTAQRSAALQPVYPSPQPSRGLPLRPCRHVAEFEKLNRISEGTYGVVYRVRDTQSGRIMALKRLKPANQVAGQQQQQPTLNTGFPLTSLREITTLLQCQHPNIVNMREVVTGDQPSDVFMVMEYVEHDLRELLEYQRHPQSEQAADNQQQQQLRSLLTLSEVKQLMLQLLSAIDYLHYNYIVHRDVKTSNLLLSNEGFLKLADFGLARRLADPLPAAEFSESNSGGHLTPLVVTLWYRAPEILLGSQYYGFPVDLWSVGCVMAELINDGHALFPGQSELEQLNLIFKMLGTPTERSWPDFPRLPHCQSFQFAQYRDQGSLDRLMKGRLPPSGMDLLRGLLTFDPERRLTAAEALQHPFFTESPLPKHPSMFPSWPSKSDKIPASTPHAPKGHQTDSSIDT